MNTDQQLAMLRQKKDIEEGKRTLERESSARYVLKRLSEETNKYLLTRLVKYCFFILDLSFVREGLIDIYRTTKLDYLKEMIRDLHDGKIDASDISEEIDFWDNADRVHQEAREEAQREFEIELGLNDELINLDSRTHLNKIYYS
ncbi:MAG: hypothetical protein MK033_07125 [Candidatus Caenarcaniphilales bacterium]|nr:hypothetical protein [Candidatus Caenarcaniphilales bacterium]